MKQKLSDDLVKLLEPVRKEVLTHVEHSQRMIQSEIGGGWRRYDDIRRYVERYIAFQTAADILGGYEFKQSCDKTSAIFL